MYIPFLTIVVSAVLYLETSKGQVQLDMQGILPRMMGQQCIQAQYGTLLGHSMVPLPIR